jgi:hypothetical protein
MDSRRGAIMRYYNLGDCITTDTGLVIPKDVSNRDYQEYLATLPAMQSDPTPFQKAIEKRLAYESEQQAKLQS